MIPKFINIYINITVILYNRNITHSVTTKQEQPPQHKPTQCHNLIKSTRVPKKEEQRKMRHNRRKGPKKVHPAPWDNESRNKKRRERIVTRSNRNYPIIL